MCPDKQRNAGQSAAWGRVLLEDSKTPSSLRGSTLDRKDLVFFNITATKQHPGLTVRWGRKSYRKELGLSFALGL